MQLADGYMLITSNDDAMQQHQRLRVTTSSHDTDSTGRNLHCWSYMQTSMFQSEMRLQLVDTGLNCYIWE